MEVQGEEILRSRSISDFIFVFAYDSPCTITITYGGTTHETEIMGWAFYREDGSTVSMFLVQLE